MKTIKQLLRQPLKTLLGVVLMTLAVAVLCICVGQMLAAQSTKNVLDQQFSTVAIPSLQEDLTGADQLLVEDELLQWLENMARENPGIMKNVAYNSVISAYIPQMVPYNKQAQENFDGLGMNEALQQKHEDDYTGVPHYDSAMLVITLEQIGEIIDPLAGEEEEEVLTREDFTSSWDYNNYLSYLQRKQAQKEVEASLQRTDATGYRVLLTGTITQVLSLPDGMRDPMGMTARLTLVLPSMQDIEELGLTVGQQYIVYGMDYFDDYQFLVEYMKTTSFKHVKFAPFDPALLREPKEKEIERFRENKKIDVAMMYNNAPLEQWQYNLMNSVSMTLCLPESLTAFQEFYNEDGVLVQLLPPSDVLYTDGDGQPHSLPMDEFMNRYTLPMIAPVFGGVEEFLASAAGESWQAALEQSNVNNHAFSVVGVNEIHHLGSFALDKTTIGEGREFTQEEVERGAKVCLIHEWVAQNSGLQVGDTITLRFYQPDYALPYQTTLADGKGLVRPAASLYFETTPFVETAEYTIVGFWQGVTWPDGKENYYSFSANTVFVPAASVQTPMEQPGSIPFVSVVLENGTIEQFHDLIKRAGYAGRFKYIDQGYSNIASNFHNYESLGQQIMAVGVALYGILLLLFLVLYPSTQRKTVRTMQSLGCTYFSRFHHVLLSSMFVLVMATVIGGLIGSALWDRVVSALQATTESSIALRLEPGVLGMVALAQLLLALVMNILVALVMAAPRGLSARR